MSLDKAIEHCKEKRKPYYGSKAFDRTCRNHGGCDACLSNRMHSHNKRLEKMKCSAYDVRNQQNLGFSDRNDDVND